VRNLPDRRVEAVVEGEEDRVKQLVSWCREGPPSAQVSKVDVSREPYKGEYSVFTIMR